MDRISRTLIRLGIGRRYASHAYLSYILRRIMQDETRLYNARRDLYSPAAQRFGVSPQALERALGRAVFRGWYYRPAAYAALMGEDGSRPPSVKAFLEAVCAQLQRAQEDAGLPG